MNAYLSPQSEKYLNRLDKREKFRKFRIGVLSVLLLGVGFWAWETYLQDHKTFAWDQPVRVAVVAVVEGDKQQQIDWFVQSFLSRAGAPRKNLLEVEAWLQSEYERHTGDNLDIFDLAVRGPVHMKKRPPALPKHEDGFYERWSGIRNFLGYFKEIHKREDLLLGAYDITVFVYFYDETDPVLKATFELFDSVASKRDGMGIVFAPLSRSKLGYTTQVVAHEILHTLGASDKYEGNRSVFPQGYADPQQTPLFPQENCEIMSLGRPISKTEDEYVDSLDECVVGDVTAEEINWVAK